MTSKCSCCSGNAKTKTLKPPSKGKCYNKNGGTSAKWARKTGNSRTEFTVRVKDGKKFGGPQWQKDSCGDGTFGFPTRRTRQDEVAFETGLDGYPKKKRHTLVNTRSALSVSSRRPKQIWGTKCGCWTKDDISRVSEDRLLVAEKKIAQNKTTRAANRNNGSRRGIKKIRKVS